MLPGPANYTRASSTVIGPQRRGIMNRARILLILMALAVPVVAQQRWPKEPTAFGGLRWGATVAEAKQAYPSAQQSIWGNDPPLHSTLAAEPVLTRLCLTFRDNL